MICFTQLKDFIILVYEVFAALVEGGWQCILFYMGVSQYQQKKSAMLVKTNAIENLLKLLSVIQKAQEEGLREQSLERKFKLLRSILVMKKCAKNEQLLGDALYNIRIFSLESIIFCYHV